MKETGIIMSGDHPRLILDNLKTMTRRTYGLEEINEDPDRWLYKGFKDGYAGFSPKVELAGYHSGLTYHIKCPYGQVGDLLYVKETFATRNDGEQVLHKAEYEHIVEALDLDNFAKEQGLPPLNIKWTSARFMPKKYSRIWREITELRAERLQDITEEDCIAEGIAMSKLGTRFTFFFTGKAWVNSATDAYRSLWDSINIKKYPWPRNPWVWSISFKELA